MRSASHDSAPATRKNEQADQTKDLASSCVFSSSLSDFEVLFCFGLVLLCFQIKKFHKGYRVFPFRQGMSVGIQEQRDVDLNQMQQEGV